MIYSIAVAVVSGPGNVRNWVLTLFLRSHSIHRNLSGMAIADITLLSGFEVKTEDLDKVSSSL